MVTIGLRRAAAQVVENFLHDEDVEDLHAIRPPTPEPEFVEYGTGAAVALPPPAPEPTREPESAPEVDQAVAPAEQTSHDTMVDGFLDEEAKP